MVTKKSVNRSGLDDSERKEGRRVGEEAAGKLGLPCTEASELTGGVPGHEGQRGSHSQIFGRGRGPAWDLVFD